MKYFIYIRKSTDDKAKQIQSIPDQKRILSALAKERGLKVVDIIIDEKSAKAPGRKGFGEMVERLQSNDANGIICWKMDRLARNTVDGGNLMWMLQNGTVKEFVTPTKTYNTEDNTLVLSVEFGMATQFSRELRENVNRGMQSKVDKGWATYRVPIGYLNEVNGVKGEKKVLVDPDNFKALQRIWLKCIKDELTLKELHEYMKTDEPIYRNGKLLPFSTFCKVFRSKFYCGLLKYKGVWKVASHQPMITQTQFEQVQNILDKKFKSVRQSNLEFDFKGFFKCGCCDAWITAEEHNKMVKRTGQKAKYRYYRCVHRKKDVVCTEKPINEIKVVETIQKELDQLRIPQALMDFGLRKIKELEQAQDKTESTVESQLRKEITALNQRLKTIRNNFAEESDPNCRQVIKDRLNELEIDLRKLEQDLATEIESQQNPHEELTTSFAVIDKAQDYLENGTSQQKKTILRHLGSNWQVVGQKLDYKPSRTVKALKKTHQLLLAENNGIGTQKNHSMSDLSMTQDKLDIVWSAQRESNSRLSLGKAV